MDQGMQLKRQTYKHAQGHSAYISKITSSRVSRMRVLVRRGDSEIRRAASEGDAVRGGTALMALLLPLAHAVAPPAVVEAAVADVFRE
jgi:hypothetical protein